MTERAARIIERTEIEDRLRDMEKDLRRHTWGVCGLLAAAAAFFVMGVVYGTPGHVAGVFLCLTSLVPLTRRMMKADEIRRARNELDRLLEPGDENGEAPRLLAPADEGGETPRLGA